MQSVVTAEEMSGVLTTLRARPETVPWTCRRDIAEALPAFLNAPVRPEWVLPLVELLAADPKPEVRQGIARLLHLLRDGEMAKFAARLSEDCNAFVRNAAQRSLDRKRRGQADAGRKRRSVAQIETDYDTIQRLHGRPAAERARQMCERSNEVLMGTAVHNLRGIITPLKVGAAALVRQLDEGRLDPKGARETAARIADRVAFVERLLGDMRAFSMPLATERRRERLSDMVAEARATVMEYLRAAGRDPSSISLFVSVPENLSLEVCRHQIVVAIGNVLKNAFEAIAANDSGVTDKRITVEAGDADGHLRLAVRDTGPGLDEEDLRELRDFVPGRTSKKDCGTGFGLPIARRYVMAHGGSLTVDSRLGGGTVVTIVLPLEQEDEE